MDGSSVATLIAYGVVSPEAQSATRHAGILLPLLDQRRSIGLVEAAGLIGVSSRTIRRYAAEGPCSVRFACGLGAISSPGQGRIQKRTTMGSVTARGRPSGDRSSWSGKALTSFKRGQV